MDIRDGTELTNSHWTQKEGKPIILIDFDHTITKKCLACSDGLKGDGLQENAKEAIQELAKEFRIWIFTGSGIHLDYAIPLQRTKASIEEFLRKHDIPFEKVLQTKPPACFIIDDRAIHHEGWEETIREIKHRRNLKEK